jgi:hypothetical protein
MKNLLLLMFLFITISLNAQSSTDKYETFKTSLEGMSLVDYAVQQERRFEKSGKTKLLKGRLLVLTGVALGVMGAVGLSELSGVPSGKGKEIDTGVAIGAMALGSMAFTVGLANITIGKKDYRESKRMLKNGFKF